VTDGLLRRDVLSPTNEEDYFLFREAVGLTVACFLRDPEVPKLAATPGVSVVASSLTVCPASHNPPVTAH
jgi:hypothetical protein